MARFECGVCGYIYDEEHASRKFEELSECPICGSPKSSFKAPEQDSEENSVPVFKIGGDDEEEAPESKSEFVVEKRQEFWSPLGSKTETKTTEAPKATWTISGMGTVQKVIDSENPSEEPVREQVQTPLPEKKSDSPIQTFYNDGNSVKSPEEIEREKEQTEVKDSFRPLWGTGTGTIQTVITPGEKKENEFEETSDDSDDEFVFEEFGKEDKEDNNNPFEEISEGGRTIEPADVVSVESLVEETFFNDSEDDEELGNISEFVEIVDDEIETEEAEEVAKEAPEAVAEITPEESVVDEVLFGKDEEDSEGTPEVSEDDFASEDEFVFEEAPAEDAPAEEAPEEALAEEVIAEETSEEEVFEEEIIAQEAPVEEVITEESIVEDAEEETFVFEEAPEDETENDFIFEESSFEEPAEDAAEEIIEESVEDTAETVADETVEEISFESAEEIAEDMFEEATEEPAEEIVDETTEEVADEAVEETIDDVDEETADEDECIQVPVAYSMLKGSMKYSVLYDEQAKKIFDNFPVMEERVSNGLENIILMPAQLNPLPLAGNTEVETRTVIGALTACPVEVRQPFCFSKLFLWGEHIPNNDEPEEYNNQAFVLVKGKNGHIPEVSSREDLKEEVAIAKERFHGTPVGVDLVAGRIESDLASCVYAKVDFVILNDLSSRILPYALRRAKNFLNKVNAKIDILVCVDALKDAQELAKIIALGADFVLVERGFDLDMAARITDDLKEIARSTGHDNVHDINMNDICTVDSDIASYTDIAHI